LSLLHYNLDIPSLDLADKLADEYSVMLAPGSAFGYENYLRLGIGQDPPVFAAGLRAAGACFADLQAGALQAGALQAGGLERRSTRDG
jgi:aspartate/methionine/tyrosine aminotransferase